MQKIPIDKAVSGMVLGKPLSRKDGVVLMGEGTVLTEQLIDRLKDMDIAKVFVKGRPLTVEGEESKTLEQRLHEVDNRFSLVEEDRLSCQIRDIIKADIKQRFSETDD